DRQLVGELSSLGKCLAEQHAVELGLDRAHFAAVFDRGVGLGIECFLMGHPTGQKDVNDRLRRPLEVLVILQFGLSLFRSEQLRQRQSGTGEHTDREKAATREPFKVSGSTTFEASHGSNSCCRGWVTMSGIRQRVYL